ncbi:MAG: SDR family NAD(P)-dependent oxidoreductase [Deltaproteobacteria bacterium]|nr:SDR family NAD(P)-dependent oxidoreductase [Deltaproteobacteria bacterium]MBW1950274.1 SDR family NAD(P)-dependent oxidoreductase [Deltaproteobacteria bacterium]MBW2008966.1 SDR family NAD(P)-dependent oxidoreductase [Deltaproteobacteria bacterium]
MVDLTDKVVLVTGASSGIGAAMARCFSREGAYVALTARSREGLHRTSKTCPGPTLEIPGDLLRSADREKIVDRILERWNRIDVLVNNAGLGMYGSFLEVTEEIWRRVFEINLFAAMEMTRSVLPVMLERDRGPIFSPARS